MRYCVRLLQRASRMYGVAHEGRIRHVIAACTLTFCFALWLQAACSASEFATKEDDGLPSFQSMTEYLDDPTKMFNRRPTNPRVVFPSANEGVLEDQFRRLESDQDAESDTRSQLKDAPEMMLPAFSLDLKAMLVDGSLSALAHVRTAFHYYVGDTDSCKNPSTFSFALGREVRLANLFLPYMRDDIENEDVVEIERATAEVITAFREACGADFAPNASDKMGRFALLYLNKETGCDFIVQEPPSLDDSYRTAVESVRQARTMLRKVSQIADDDRRWGGAASLNRESNVLLADPLFAFEMNLDCAKEHLTPNQLYDLYAELAAFNQRDNELGYLLIDYKKYPLWMEARVGLQIVREEVRLNAVDPNYRVSFHTARIGESVLRSIDALSSFTYYASYPDVWVAGLLLYFDYFTFEIPVSSGERLQRLLLMREKAALEMCRFLRTECDE